MLLEEILHRGNHAHDLVDLPFLGDPGRLITGENEEDALARLANYGFPGNVRELHAILYRAAMSAPGRELEAEHLSLPAEEAPRPRTGPAEARALLEHHGGNVSAAARAAGVPRSTFRAWIAGRRS